MPQAPKEEQSAERADNKRARLGNVGGGKLNGVDYEIAVCEVPGERSNSQLLDLSGKRGDVSAVDRVASVGQKWE